MKVISVTANVFAIVASGIAIYIFFYKKETIYSAFNLLLNYSYQLSLSEFKEKLEKLNDYNAKEAADCDTIINLFNEILGQIRGNDKLKSHFSAVTKKIEDLVEDKRKLTEPRKRAMVSELRERLRHVNVQSIDDLLGN
ncbi:hypothetical protein AMS57_02120 [Pseudoalteromonas undina]|nr:hypothetical protein AMS57_02120 [Pseudoalteromonas undina]